MAQPGFWNQQAKAQELISQTNALKTKYDTFQQLQQQYDELTVSAELLTEEADPQLANEFAVGINKLQQQLQKFELSLLLNGRYDSHNAILEIHPGAGGTESQDWGAMLLRMYIRWAEQHHFTVETLNYEAGEEAGVKSATLMIKGQDAYGFLRSERGVHRLVRISPFDAAGRRHTSFTSVDVMPELDDTVNVDIKSDDLRIDVYRASGAGGQHVNKTSSAVRITHLPTGIVVASQAERSQLQNRQTAMNMLRAKLYQRELAKKEQERQQIQGEQAENGWGSQIRSYVFQPYTMVKDHRTGYETGNGQAVLDGELDPFINVYLQQQLKAKQSPA
ncbi:peptide chain release factor 2 [Loigolactobacillus rennini DSM 20253]|uniref:Peptide chain release factor 2 n=2 Tax=Loigolactobacillus rennini TaxID=238013 RepID=A0A0R2D492_9LACO|nr:peptide chain release factor 2 [Loigolactobacillus rennini DSM 20253]